MNILFPALGGLGLLLLLGSSSSAKAAGSSAKPNPKTALDFQTRIADALSRSDAAALMAIANEMQAAGLTNEAAALRTVALNLQTLGALGGAGSAGSKSPGQPAVLPSVAIPNPPLVVVPPLISPSSIPLPAGVPMSSETAQRQQIAQAMAVDLRNTNRYKENKILVVRFQQQEGLKTDGLYGPKSALALAKLGIVPPRPRYWAKKTVAVDKVQFAAEMTARSVTDPARSADWIAASKVQNDPIG
jgi:murein L,D-transpeptidase YcbB/YkuD